jgi:hypothetical protein
MVENLSPIGRVALLGLTPYRSVSASRANSAHADRVDDGTVKGGQCARAAKR